MSRLAGLLRPFTRWYISSVLLAAVGIAVGYVVFFHVFPGRPQIGVIDIPFTVISDNTAFNIGEMLDYAQRTDSIKGVVIRLDSPGGGAAASEQLFLKTVRLRETKPVVVVAQDIVASGGYMWSMGSNYVYAKPTSVIGSVGAILVLPGPARPDEDVVFTGPSKRTGGPRRSFVEMLETVKEAFLSIVTSQRGDKLKITREELAEARVYSGMAAVRLGLIDAIGSDTDAIKKAASLAGVSHYELVDVNFEVFRLLVLKFRKIFPDVGTDGLPQALSDIQSLRELSASLLDNDAEEVLGGLPEDLNLPKIYHLYVSPSE